MFPPETMHDDLPVAGAAASGGRERERPGALGDHARALGEQPHGRGGLVERTRERAVEQLRRAAPTSPGSAPRLPEPSTNDGVYSTAVGSPAANVAADSGAPVSGSTA